MFREFHRRIKIIQLIYFEQYYLGLSDKRSALMQLLEYNDCIMHEEFYSKIIETFSKKKGLFEL